MLPAGGRGSFIAQLIGNAYERCGAGGGEVHFWSFCCSPGQALLQDSVGPVSLENGGTQGIKCGLIRADQLQALAHELLLTSESSGNCYPNNAFVLSNT